VHLLRILRARVSRGCAPSLVHTRPRVATRQDDRLVNVEAARAAGWAAIHFTGAEALEAELALLGVTIASDAL
jgi:hypothetical protein